MEGIIFIGIQASGKTTFYQQRLYKTHLWLSMDMLKTRHRENILLSACIATGQRVVIDNTNPTRAGRARYIDAFRRGRFTVAGYYFRSAPGECLARNKNRPGKERIPEAGLLGTFKRLEIPSYQEGFDKLYHVRIDAEGNFIVENWKEEG